MDLVAAYGSDGDSDDSCCNSALPASKRIRIIDTDRAAGSVIISSAHCEPSGNKPASTAVLPPPPLDDVDIVGADSRPCDGRVRSFAHVDGHFAVHVYLPVDPSPSLRAALRFCSATLVQAASTSPKPVHQLESLEYHVSLSRTVMLPRHHIDPFADALRVALRSCVAVDVTADCTLCELSNDDDTRFFAALEISRHSAGCDGLFKLVDSVDAVLARYEQPVFYSERRMHFSIAWSLAPLPPLPQLPASICGNEMRFERVACRIGERILDFKLSGERAR